jgi:phosphoglycerol transferase
VALAIAATAAVLIATVGGFSGLFAYIVTPQLRAWSRMSIFIAFFSLAGVALAIDWFLARQAARVGLALLVLLVTVGFLDQTNASSTPQYDFNRQGYEHDAAFVHVIENRLPRGAAVFELPYEPFPEPQPAFVPPTFGPYDMSRPYLHSHDLRWSYGLMKGRAGDWQAALVQLPPPLVARALAAIGFDGLYVDRNGYADHGNHLMAELAREAGPPLTGSDDARDHLAFFDVRESASRIPSAERRTLARAVLRPMTLDFAGFLPLEETAQARVYRAGATAAFVVTNPSDAPRRATFAATFASPAGEPSDVALAFPDGTRTLTANTKGVTITRRLVLRPGTTTITVRTQGPAQFAIPDQTQPYYLRVLDPVLIDGAFGNIGSVPSDRRAAAFLAPFGKL